MTGMRRTNCAQCGCATRSPTSRQCAGGHERKAMRLERSCNMPSQSCRMSRRAWKMHARLT
eukprot:6079477-Lingulodinium_polyedra.AAC.1